MLQNSQTPPPPTVSPVPKPEQKLGCGASWPPAPCRPLSPRLLPSPPGRRRRVIFTAPPLSRNSDEPPAWLPAAPVFSAAITAARPPPPGPQRPDACNRRLLAAAVGSSPPGCCAAIVGWRSAIQKAQTQDFFFSSLYSEVINPLNPMAHAGKKDKSSKKEKLMLRKGNLKKQKVKEEISDTQSPEIHEICFGNEDALNVTKKGKQATVAAKARNKLLLKKKRRQKLSQGDLDSINKKKRREKRSLDDLDNTKKEKRREKMSEDDLDSTKKKKRREKKSEGDFDKSMLGAQKNQGKSNKTSRREKRVLRGDKSIENKCDAEEESVDEISSVDEDCSRGMKKWLLDYQQRRQGLEVLQQRLDEFMIAHEARQEQARKERETLAAEEGWTVVVHHKGRKKTTDSESGTAVGSISQAAAEDKMAKKKQKELALDFYRFQKREAHRNEVMMLQSKFEQDKKRLLQLRAARKFRPY